MNYKEIRKILEENDVEEVVKAIISFETSIKDEEEIQYLSDILLKYGMTETFLADEIIQEATLYICEKG